MHTTILLEEIQWLLEAIKEQYEVIRTYEEKIPQIELDILMENVRKLYGKLHLIGKANDPFTWFDSKAAVKSSVNAEEINPVTAPPVTPVKEQNTQAPGPAVTIRYNEGNGVASSYESLHSKEKLQDPDLFDTELPGFSGRLQEARQQGMAPKNRMPRSYDLKTLISINEKFLFINELFDGNLREYNENIDALSRFPDFKPAMEYLDQLRKKNLWNSESMAFLRLKELLEERFK